MSSVIKLDKPIQAHGKEVTELELREPTTEEVMEEGYPYLIVQGNGGVSGVQLQPKVVARYVMRLAAIPMPSVKQMSIGDLQSAQAVVMGFFGQTGSDRSSD